MPACGRLLARVSCVGNGFQTLTKECQVMPRYRFSVPAGQYAFGRPWTPAVRALIICNVGVFLLQMAAEQWTGMALLGLQLPEMLQYSRYWQPFTYLFLHGGFWHLAFNMFALWMFGSEVEAVLGTGRFILYYLAIGVGAGWCVAALGWLFGERSVTIGASGAIFGVLLAYGVLFAENTITLLLFFVLPLRMKAKTMVWFFAAFEFVAGVGKAFGQISHVAHLSGLLLGYLFFQLFWPQFLPSPPWSEKWRRWRTARRSGSAPPPVRFDPEQEVDRLLEKISKHGIASLSEKERRILAEAARRRQNH